MKLTDLQEARYAHKTPTADDVFKIYKSIEEKYDSIWGEKSHESHGLGQPYSLNDPIGIKAWKKDKYYGGSYTSLEIAFHPDTPKEVGEEWIKKFIRKNNLPYSNTEVDDVDRPGISWAIYVLFDPEYFPRPTQ